MLLFFGKVVVGPFGFEAQCRCGAALLLLCMLLPCRLVLFVSAWLLVFVCLFVCVFVVSPANLAGFVDVTV